MTYKAAAAGLDLGGGKAVIIGDPARIKTEELLRAYGRFVETLGGRYITAEDVGTALEDMDIVRRESRWVTGCSHTYGGSGDPSPVTAYGVLQGIKACCPRGLRRRRPQGPHRRAPGCRQGRARSVRLPRRGGRQRHDRRHRRRQPRARRSPTTASRPLRSTTIHKLEADIFAPCALGGGINDDTISEFRCKIIAGAANNQLAREEHGDKLRDLGILYAPDFVINAGGSHQRRGRAPRLRPGAGDEPRRRHLQSSPTDLHDAERARDLDGAGRDGVRRGADPQDQPHPSGASDGIRPALGPPLDVERVLRIIGTARTLPDAPVPDGLCREGPHRAVPLARAAAHVRRARGRPATSGPHRHLRALLGRRRRRRPAPLYACDDTDWVFPSYRQNAIGILRGVPASTVLAWWRGYGGKHGFWNPREHRVGPICVPIATHLPHAVGVAWAAKIRNDQTASLAWFGDGATSEGDFHEAMNFAAVFKTPTIFFCVNNQWAISTPISQADGNRDDRREGGGVRDAGDPGRRLRSDRMLEGDQETLSIAAEREMVRR